MKRVLNVTFVKVATQINVTMCALVSVHVQRVRDNDFHCQAVSAELFLETALCKQLSFSAFVHCCAVVNKRR